MAIEKNSAPVEPATGSTGDTHGTLWRDIRYLASLIGGYLKAEPILGSILIVVALAGSALIAGVAISVAVQIGQVIDAMTSGDAPRAWRGLGYLFLSLAGLMVVEALVYGARYIFRIRWRTVFTRRLLARWMADDRYYHMERRSGIDNPEQRIQEDLFLVAQQVTTLLPTMVTSVTTLVLAMGVLWGLSKPLSLAPVGVPVTVPHDLLVFAIVFGVLWVIGAHYVGRAITRIEVKRQGLEADFRHGLSQVREFGEAIAFERAGEREAARALGRYDLIRDNWRRYTVAQIRLLLFNLTTGTIVPRLLPIALSAPHILAGTMTVGDLTVVSATFGNVLSGLTFIAAYYDQLAALRASVARVRFFQLELEQPLHSAIVIREDGDAVAADHLNVDLPDGTRLLSAVGLGIAAGERAIIRGRSGAGKSTLLRVLAGLWPYGDGAIRMPPRDQTMFLPQRAYVPEGTLAEALAFPDTPRDKDRARYVEALEAVALGAFADRLDLKADWRQTLSPGEQQRLAAARALLREPRFLFLDEATSALDLELEAQLYDALTRRLPDTAIVSVAHRPTVARHHVTAIDVGVGDARPGTIATRPLLPQMQKD